MRFTLGITEQAASPRESQSSSAQESARVAKDASSEAVEARGAPGGDAENGRIEPRRRQDQHTRQVPVAVEQLNTLTHGVWASAEYSPAAAAALNEQAQTRDESSNHSRNLPA